MHKKILNVSTYCALFFLVLVLIVFTLNYFCNKTISNIKQSSIVFSILKGDTVNQIVQNLYSKGWLEHPTFFKLLVEIQGFSKLVKAGDYRINAHMTYRELLRMFTDGAVYYHKFSIIEGSTVKELIKFLNNTNNMTDYINEKKFIEFTSNLGIEGNSEGFFYPDTYFYTSGDSRYAILIRSYQAMKKQLSILWNSRQSDLPYKSFYDALIIASLIEKETSINSEKEKISGVFVRRLKKNMYLQADPSVIYGLGKSYTGNLTRKSLQHDSRYNLYRYKGLPPSPISLVSRDSLYAALHPDSQKTLYFVAKGDGYHHFSTTINEHQKAVVEFQKKNRKKDYRSKPEDFNNEKKIK